MRSCTDELSVFGLLAAYFKLYGVLMEFDGF